RNRKVGDLHGHVSDHYVNALSMSADARTALSAGVDGTLRLWDLSRGKLLASLVGHTTSVAGLALAPDGSRAVSCAGHAVKVWDLAAARNRPEEDRHTNR